jgi:DNA-binding protein H-NS
MQEDIKQLIAQRDALDRQIEEATQNARNNALETCKALINEYGFSAAELGLRRLAKNTKVIAPKYIGPQGQTWAGRGRKPLWLQKAEIEEGKTAEDFRIRTGD